MPLCCLQTRLPGSSRRRARFRVSGAGLRRSRALLRLGEEDGFLRVASGLSRRTRGAPRPPGSRLPAKERSAPALAAERALSSLGGCSRGDAFETRPATPMRPGPWKGAVALLKAVPPNAGGAREDFGATAALHPLKGFDSAWLGRSWGKSCRLWFAAQPHRCLLGGGRGCAGRRCGDVHPIPWCLPRSLAPEQSRTGAPRRGAVPVPAGARRDSWRGEQHPLNGLVLPGRWSVGAGRVLLAA